MMVLLFVLIGLTVIAVYLAWYKLSIFGFFLTFVIAVIWFAHHATDKLNIQL